MKKLLAFLIMLIVGTALFAVPDTDERGVNHTITTIKIIPQMAGDFTVVADVSLDISPAENLCNAQSNFEAPIQCDFLFDRNVIATCPYSQEVKPYSGYSKAAVYRINDYVTGGIPAKRV